MSAIVLRTPENIVNYALTRAGSPLRVDNLLNGTRASNAALRVYGQTRDELLSGGDWDFCERTVQATLLKQAPADYITTPWTLAYPQLPWLYEYAYPTDALKVRAVKRQPIQVPNFDPRYNRFDVANDDGFTPPQKVILTNIPAAIIVYAGQETNPLNWTPEFIEVFADALGKALAPVLVSPDIVKLPAAEEAADTQLPGMRHG